MSGTASSPADALRGFLRVLERRGQLFLRTSSTAELIQSEGGSVYGKTAVLAFYIRFRDAPFGPIDANVFPPSDGKLSHTAHSRQHEPDRKLGGKLEALLSEIDVNRDDALTVQDLFNTWLTDGVRRKDGNAARNRSDRSAAETCDRA